MTASLWAFVNAKERYVKIHSERCHCLSRETKTDRSNLWKGPFSSYVQAVGWAKAKGMSVESCKFCHPHLST
jgi:hypothetical protein